MENKSIIDSLNAAIEDLSRIEHERWAHWQKYMHSKGSIQADGSLVIPRDLVEKWERQIDTPYANLSEEEKESDREQVRKYLPTIEQILLISHN